MFSFSLYSSIMRANGIGEYAKINPRLVHVYLCKIFPAPTSVFDNGKCPVFMPSEVNKSRVGSKCYNRISHVISSKNDVIRGSVVPATDSHIIPFRWWRA